MKFVEIESKIYNLGFIYTISDVSKYQITPDVMKFGFCLSTLTGQKVHVIEEDKRKIWKKYNTLVKFLSNEEKFLDLDVV